MLIDLLFKIRMFNSVTIVIFFIFYFFWLISHTMDCYLTLTFKTWILLIFVRLLMKVLFFCSLTTHIHVLLMHVLFDWLKHLKPFFFLFFLKRLSLKRIILYFVDWFFSHRFFYSCYCLSPTGDYWVILIIFYLHLVLFFFFF